MCCERKDAIQDRGNGSSPGPIPRELGQYFFFLSNFFFIPWCCSPATLQRQATGLFIKIKFHPQLVAWVQDLTLSLPEDGHDARGTLLRFSEAAPCTVTCPLLWEGTPDSPDTSRDTAVISGQWVCPQRARPGSLSYEAQCLGCSAAAGSVSHPEPPPAPALISAKRWVQDGERRGMGGCPPLTTRHLRLVTPMPQLGHRTLPDLEPRAIQKS